MCPHPAALRPRCGGRWGGSPLGASGDGLGRVCLGGGGAMSSCTETGSQTALSPSPFCPHRGLRGCHGFNALAILSVEKRSPRWELASSRVGPRVPRDSAALGMSPPKVRCWRLSTEFPTGPWSRTWGALGVGRQGGARPAWGSRSCAPGGDPLSPEALEVSRWAVGQAVVQGGLWGRAALWPCVAPGRLGAQAGCVVFAVSHGEDLHPG